MRKAQRSIEGRWAFVWFVLIYCVSYPNGRERFISPLNFVNNLVDKIFSNIILSTVSLTKI